MTVKEMMARMDAVELAEWRAFYNIDPFDQRRRDLQGAIVASTIYNMLRRKGKAKPAADFMPDFTRARNNRQGINDKLRAFFKARKNQRGK